MRAKAIFESVGARAASSVAGLTDMLVLDTRPQAYVCSGSTSASTAGQTSAAGQASAGGGAALICFLVAFPFAPAPFLSPLVVRPANILVKAAQHSRRRELVAADVSVKGHWRKEQNLCGKVITVKITTLTLREVTGQVLA